MKASFRKRILCIAALALGVGLSAQSENEYRLKGGGFGHFFTGFAYCDLPGLQDYLAHEDLLGPGLEIGPTGRIQGGQGFGILGKRFMIGGGGFGTSFVKGSTPRGKADVLFGGGAFHLGCILKSNRYSFSYGYLGFGGAAVSLKLRNYSDEPLPFDTYDPVPRGEYREYNFSGTLYEAGVSWKRVIPMGLKHQRDVGGLIVGADAGISFLDGIDGWKTVMFGPPRLYPVQFFARLTLGGGGLSFEE